VGCNAATPCPAVRRVREAEGPRNTSNVDPDQQLIGAFVGGDSIPDVPLPEGPPGMLCRLGVNRWSRSRGGDGCCVWVRVGLMSY
jgi:hypothetical protein